MLIKLRRHFDNELMLVESSEIVMVRGAGQGTSNITLRTCGSHHVMESVDDIARLLSPPPPPVDKRTPQIVNSGCGRVGAVGWGELPPRPAPPQTPLGPS